MTRCLFNSSFKEFLELNDNSILGILCEPLVEAKNH